MAVVIFLGYSSLQAAMLQYRSLAAVPSAMKK